MSFPHTSRDLLPTGSLFLSSKRRVVIVRLATIAYHSHSTIIHDHPIAGSHTQILAIMISLSVRFCSHACGRVTHSTDASKV